MPLSLSAIVFQVLGVLIASHSAFTAGLPRGDYAEEPYFLLDGRYALHRVCVRAGAFPFLDSFGVPGAYWSPLVGGCGVDGCWRYPADYSGGSGTSANIWCVGAVAFGDPVGVADARHGY